MDSVKKIFLNFNFYVFFIIFFVLFIYVIDVKYSFSYFFWSYILEKNIQTSNELFLGSNFPDTSINIMFANLNVSKSIFSSNNLMNLAIKESINAQNLINMDLIWVDWTISKKKTYYETLIKKTEQSISKLDEIMIQLNSQYNDNSQISLNCENNKKSSDSSFVQWLNQNDYFMMIEWFNDSLKNWPCYIENRIRARAISTIYSKLNYLKSILEKRNNILENNVDIIISNNDYFDSNVLEQLVSLRNQLKNISFSSNYVEQE